VGKGEVGKVGNASDPDYRLPVQTLPVEEEAVLAMVLVNWEPTAVVVVFIFLSLRKM
jgi:hypothetical protein